MLCFWELTGPGFTTFHLPPPLNKVTFAICNDLNVLSASSWSLDQGPFELADYTISTRSNVLVLLNAWLDSGQDRSADEDWHTLNYWSLRLKPLWDPSSSPTKECHKSVVIVCNRTGHENGS